MPRRALWACSNYASWPWLGVLTCAQWEHRRVAVAPQWDLLERRRSAVSANRGRTWSRRERCSRRRGMHGDLTEFMDVPLRLDSVLMACLRCLYRDCIECYCFHCAHTETARSCHGNPCAPAALPWRPSAFAVRLLNDDTSMLLHCEPAQQNGIKAASSLSPPLCVQALPTSSWLLNASKPGYSLPICMSSRSRIMQTLSTSFRDEGVGGPQGIAEFGYGNGWTSTGGCSMVTIIGLCMSSGMKTLPVTLISSVCHPTCSTSFSADWVH